MSKKLYIQKHELIGLEADEEFNFHWNDKPWLKDTYQVRIVMLKGKIDLYETEYKVDRVEITDQYEITVEPGSTLFITAEEESVFQIGTYSDESNESGLHVFIEIASILLLLATSVLSWFVIPVAAWGLTVFIFGLVERMYKDIFCH